MTATATAVEPGAPTASRSGEPVDTVGTKRSMDLRRYVPGALGFLTLLVLWEVVGHIMEANQEIATIPPFTKVVSSVFDDGWAYYGPNIQSTVWIAVRGFLWGNLIAVAMAILVLLVPFLERPIMQLGVTSYCLPIIAIGPVLLLAYDSDTTKVIITVLFVLFGTLVNLLVGLHSADSTSLDVVRAYGGGRWQGLRKVRVMASLPSFFAGLRVAGPAAILGAILGEFFGADRGLGVGIIRSQQQLEVPRTWAIAVVGSLLGTIAYALFAFIARIATPWAPETEREMTDVLSREIAIANATVPISPSTPGGRWHILRTLGNILARFVVSLVVVIGVWMLLLRIWNIEDYLIRGPSDVWNYLTQDADSAARSKIASDLWTTLGHAAVGLLAGTVAGVVVAIMFNLFRPLEQGFTPVALVLRSTPLVAMAPLISLVFGRGIFAVAVVGGIVTFFPTLVNVSLGLREVPKQTVDLLRAYGASRRTMMLKAQIPTALPALFAALRAAAPLAITGALIAEWLITGTGMGSSMNAARNTFEYDLMWTEVAITTLGSLLIYSITVGVEGAVLGRYAPDRARAAKTGA